MNSNKPATSHQAREEPQQTKINAQLVDVNQKMRNLNNSLLTFLNKHENQLQELKSQIEAQGNDQDADKEFEEYKEKIEAQIKYLVEDRKHYEICDEKNVKRNQVFDNKHVEYFTNLNAELEEYKKEQERAVISRVLQNFFKAFIYINKKTFSSFIYNGDHIELSLFYDEFLVSRNIDFSSLVRQLLSKQTIDSAFEELQKITAEVDFENKNYLLLDYFKQIDYDFELDFDKYREYLKKKIQTIHFYYYEDKMATLYNIFELLIKNSLQSTKLSTLLILK